MTTFKRHLIAFLFTASVLAAGSAFAGEAPRAYSPEQVQQIMNMRDDGESLAAVAKVVGGTREDVKRVESSEKARRRAAAQADRGTRWASLWSRGG